MNLKRLLCKCECGSYAHPHSFWLSDQKHLLVSSVCVSCEKAFNAVFLLADLLKACPLPDFKAIDTAIGEKIEEITTPKPQKLTPDDRRFLRAMGVNYFVP